MHTTKPCARLSCQRGEEASVERSVKGQRARSKERASGAHPGQAQHRGSILPSEKEAKQRFPLILFSLFSLLFALLARAYRYHSLLLSTPLFCVLSSCVLFSCVLVFLSLCACVECGYTRGDGHGLHTMGHAGRNRSTVYSGFKRRVRRLTERIRMYPRRRARSEHIVLGYSILNKAMSLHRARPSHFPLPKFQ